MRLPTALVLACISAFGQQSQTPLPEGIYRPGNGVTPAEVVKRTDPQYSEEARIAKLTGTVKLSLIVGEDGTLRDVTVTSSPGLGLAEKSLEAIRAWQFKPGMKGGIPVPVIMDAEFQFALILDPRDWTPSRVIFDAPEGTTRPVVISAPYPAIYSETGETGMVALRFDVGMNGVATNLQILRSSSLTAESEVSRIVRGWQFLPGMKDGQPVSVRCSMDFFKGKAR